MTLDRSNPIEVARAALNAVQNERLRQSAEEHYTVEHDDAHTHGDLACAAAAYALSSCDNSCAELVWPWDTRINAKAPLRDLARAGALILAEMERRLRSGEILE